MPLQPYFLKLDTSGYCVFWAKFHSKRYYKLLQDVPDYQINKKKNSEKKAITVLKKARYDHDHRFNDFLKPSLSNKTKRNFSWTFEYLLDLKVPLGPYGTSLTFRYLLNLWVPLGHLGTSWI